VICEITFQGRREAPLTGSGILNLVEQNQPLDLPTTRVPAVPGLSFGMRVTYPDGPVPDGVRMVVTHPPLGAAGVTVESWGVSLAPDEPNLNMFTFEKPYELVEGRWVFRLMAGETVHAEAAFDVVPDIAAPEVMDACFPGLVIS